MRILLNKALRDNFAFFDPDSLACLDMASPGADVPKVTPSIRRAILAGTVIDVDNESGLKLTDKQRQFQAAYLQHLGIVPKQKVEVSDKSAIEELNNAQAQDEKVQASKGKAKAKSKKDEGVEDGEVQE
jgi:hypothetical protein